MPDMPDSRSECNGISTYRFLNRVLLFASAVLLVWILLSHLFYDGVCGFLASSGHACILCGCTRDFCDLLRGKTSFRNAYSGVIFGFLLLQVCYRVWMSFSRSGKLIWICDAIINGLIFLGFEVMNLKVMLDAQAE